jgi:hypothetical protein
LTLFTKDYSPNDLDASGFRDFVLLTMSDFRVDLSQPIHWTKVCDAEGHGITMPEIGRAITPMLEAFGAVLSPKLLSKIVKVFQIYGPVIEADRAFSSRLVR